MPRSEYPQYEAIKDKFLAEGKPLAAAKTAAARITNSKNGAVPPSHPKSRRKPV